MENGSPLLNTDYPALRLALVMTVKHFALSVTIRRLVWSTHRHDISDSKTKFRGRLHLSHAQIFKFAGAIALLL